MHIFRGAAAIAAPLACCGSMLWAADSAALELFRALKEGFAQSEKKLMPLMICLRSGADGIRGPVNQQLDRRAMIWGA